MKKWIAVLLAVLTLALCACGSRLPKDWVVLPLEEAEELYHSVDFTMDNIDSYLTLTQRQEERLNEWGEVTEVYFYSGLVMEAENFIQFRGDWDEFLMDVTVTVQRYEARLDPQTLEELEILGEIRTEESTHTVTGLWLNELMARSSYWIGYGPDGPTPDANGQLIVNKSVVTDYRVDRVRGHAEWIADIPDEYIMNTEDNTPQESMIDGAYVKFIVIEGKDYYYCYESYDNNNSYQTKGLPIRGSNGFTVGATVSFLRGRE